MARGRGAVVHLDRHEKARMIEAIIADAVDAPVSGYTILDIGTGNGDIAEYFAKANTVASVDVEDRRRAPGRADFSAVTSEVLPHEADGFDVVMSHHVIEHVDDQDRHLTEMRRVCRSDGLVYLATPNRSSPIMEGHVGNDMVLRYRDMAPLFQRNGFAVTEYGWRLVRQPDRFNAEHRFGRWIPTPIAKLLRRVYPSHAFVLRPTP